MNAQEIQDIVETRYNRVNWQKLLHGIFGAKVKFFAAPTTLAVEKAIASEAVFLGDVTLQDDHKIAIYEVHLSEHVNIERNRAGIRNLLCSQWRGGGFAGAFMLCYRNSESVLRFSYVSESWGFNDEGAYKKESTDALRFTYLLGEGHRSRTAVRQFMELMNSGLTLKDVTKAFSVEAVSKRFFDEYKKNYEDIVEYVTGKRVVKDGSKWKTEQTGVPNKKIMAQFAVFADPEKAVRDYVKKLMGRLVFIQFLQKKGWMGVPADDAAWKNGDKDFVQNLFKKTANKDTFVDDVLEPLFDDLNTKRGNDLVSSEIVGKGIKVPYLNGGLFEEDAQDNTEFPLPKKFMENLLEFFTQYNFTIDENDPDDAEVGVDPEMLSCIFENLLEDNKEKGAFYTPKEIVQYMCRESLIAHLCNGVKKNETKDRIRDFVLTHKADVLNGAENISEQVDEKLKNVKICDPAIGSGAFPMGLMRELYFCRSAIEGFDHAKAAEIKKHIIQQNIYGVDIEKGAVDIARLRFWLSLIVDEETPHALPNLDFKIMQGNSLLEQYEGVDLSDITYKTSKKEMKVGYDLLDSNLTKSKQLISFLKDKFFDCEDHETKRQIRDALKSEIQALLLEKGCGIKLDAIKDVTATDQFFLWHTWFSEVFDQGGFDIVIGNPPYIKELGNEKIFAKINETSFGKKYHQGKMDYWFFFMHKAIELANQKGVICFITSRYWINSTGSKKLISHISSAAEFINIVDIGNLKVFDNVVGHHMISVLSKQIKRRSCFYVKISETVEKLENSDFDEKRFISYDDLISPELEIVVENRKQLNTSKIIDDVCFVSQGIVEASDKISQKMYKKNPNPKHFVGEGIFVLSDSEMDTLNLTNEEKEILEKYEDSGCVNRYVIDYTKTRNLIYADAINRNKIKTVKQYSNLKKHLDYMSEYITSTYKPYGLHRARDYKDFVQPKIIGPSMFGVPNFAYDDKCLFVGMSYNIITSKNETNLFFILGLINSEFAKTWFYDNAKHRGVGVDVGVEKLRQFPIPSATKEQQQPIVDLVDKILAAKKANPQVDTSDLEKQVDQLVYKLYNLTPTEIETIEKA